MFNLLHFHFESVLRAVASVRPNDLKKLYRSFHSAQYRAAPPAQRLHLLERHIQQLSQHNDIFTEQVFRHVVQGFFKELELNQVGHVDLRIGITTKKWTWMETIVEGIQVFECERQAHPHISLSFLGALNFAKPFAEIDEIFEILLNNCSIREKFVGVDINVLPEDFHKFVQYTPSLLALQKQDMKINLHLGELFANAFSKEVLASLIPQRIGHGVKLLDDESLVRFLKQHDICLDMCPVSNTRLGVHNWQFPNNPAKRAIKLGIPVTINTDDPVLFQTTLSQEFQLAHLNTEEISIVQANTRKYGYFHG